MYAGLQPGRTQGCSLEHVGLQPARTSCEASRPKWALAMSPRAAVRLSRASSPISCGEIWLGLGLGLGLELGLGLG